MGPHTGSKTDVTILAYTIVFHDLWTLPTATEGSLVITYGLCMVGPYLLKNSLIIVSQVHYRHFVTDDSGIVGTQLINSEGNQLDLINFIIIIKKCGHKAAQMHERPVRAVKIICSLGLH